MRAAAVQLNSNEDKDRNLARAERLTRAAADGGANLIVLPEKFSVLGRHEAYRANAETLDGPTIDWARNLARELGVDLVAGSIVERRPGSDKLGNTSVHVGPDGEVRGVYRKIHMFDVTVAGKEYRESTSQEAGDEIVTSEAEDARLGLTVCYDLRFPELFRILAIRGARVLTLPAAFTKDDRSSALGHPRARPRDREPGVRGGRRPDRDPPARQRELRRFPDRRSVGRGPRARSG